MNKNPNCRGVASVFLDLLMGLAKSKPIQENSNARGEHNASSRFGVLPTGNAIRITLHATKSTRATNHRTYNRNRCCGVNRPPLSDSASKFTFYELSTHPTISITTYPQGKQAQNRWTSIMSMLHNAIPFILRLIPQLVQDIPLFLEIL